MNIYEKLQNARVELQNMNLKKSGINKFAGFKYYELADFIPHVNKIFEDLKLFSKFDLLEDKATLTITNTENLEEVIVFETSRKDANVKGANEIQQLGATHTYCRRYLYMNALEITENDLVDATIDKDRVNIDYTQKKSTTPPKNKNNKVESAKNYIKKHLEDGKDIINDYLNINDFKELKELKDENFIELAKYLYNLLEKGGNNE